MEIVSVSVSESAGPSAAVPVVMKLELCVNEIDPVVPVVPVVPGVPVVPPTELSHLDISIKS